jgi:predicted ATPase with chaperone activity
MSGHGAAYGAASLREAAARLAGTASSAALRPRAIDGSPSAGVDRAALSPVPALSDVAGQWQARRALIIAAAGGHSLLIAYTMDP